MGSGSSEETVKPLGARRSRRSERSGPCHHPLTPPPTLEGPSRNLFKDVLLLAPSTGKDSRPQLSQSQHIRSPCAAATTAERHWADHLVIVEDGVGHGVLPWHRGGPQLLHEEYLVGE